MRLYEVRIEIVAYALAESASEAEDLAREIMLTEDPVARARPVFKTMMLEWGPGCLVYGAQSDTTLGEAVAKYAERGDEQAAP